MLEHFTIRTRQETGPAVFPHTAVQFRTGPAGLLPLLLMPTSQS